VATPATQRAAPGDIYPRSTREAELCDRADTPDWLYMGVLLALDVAAVWEHGEVKYADSVAVRLTGPGAIGLAWGATLGGGYLSLPKCEPHWVPSPPREGDVTNPWPLALSLGALSAITAPVIVAVVNGFDVPLEWTTAERSGRVITAAGAALVGSLLPYLVPPKTWRASRELERLRVSSNGQGAFLSYGFRF
jgi:hypothetical protein